MDNHDVIVFEDISKKVKNGEMSPQAGEDACKSLNFLSFDIDQIQLVQDADWMSDEMAVTILKSWMRQQDNMLLELRSNLVLTPEITKQRLEEFLSAACNPSLHPDLCIKEIIHQLATAGGTRAYYNPVKFNLITFKLGTSTEGYQKAFQNLFEEKPIPYISSSRLDEYFIITLPSFLKVELHSYILSAPEKLEQKFQGGIRNWYIQGSNDELNWTTLDIQNENLDLNQPNSVKEFVIERPHGFFRSFKLTNVRKNHQGNFSIILGKFDISGKLIISKE